MTYRHLESLQGKKYGFMGSFSYPQIMSLILVPEVVLWIQEREVPKDVMQLQGLKQRKDCKPKKLPRRECVQ